MCGLLLLQFPGCQEACRFHAEASTRAQQAQPVIHTKGEGVIRVSGALAVWPRPSSASPTTPLVYVVMRKSQSGPWRQVIQTLDLTTRVPLNSDQPGSMLRVLVVDPQGLVTIYSPDESSMRDGRKKKKTVNTEIKATTSKSTATDSSEPWTLREISLIHQKVLVIGEIAWEPKATRGVYLVTWEVDGGGLKGNLFTDSTCVTLSLWPDTIYHIQVELVSRTPGVDNLKSEMMDLDTGRAQKVSTESQEDLNMIQGEVREDVDFNSPLLSVLVGAVRGEKTRHKWHSMELILGCSAAFLLFSVVLVVAFFRCKRHSAIENMITGSTSIRSHKLVEDYTGYTGKNCHYFNNCRYNDGSHATVHVLENECNRVRVGLHAILTDKPPIIFLRVLIYAFLMSRYLYEETYCSHFPSVTDSRDFKLPRRISYS